MHSEANCSAVYCTMLSAGTLACNKPPCPSCLAAKYLQGFARFDPFSSFIDCPPNRPHSPYHRWRFCDLGRVPTPCVVYSVGPVQQDYAFEKEILSQTKCEVHTFDCTADGKSVDPNRHKFHKLCFGRNKTDHKTLREVVTMLGHHRGIEAMKIGEGSADAS